MPGLAAPLDTVLHIAPFNVRLRSPLAGVARHLETVYARTSRLDAQAFVDFDVQILPAAGVRRWWRPQARFLLDGHEPFYPLPAAEAGPLFEWGLNWCVAQRALGLLVMHAAVVANAEGDAIMMPGFPGAGKSTLCASLVLLQHWRLLSDELTLLEPATGLVQPHPRPISLKNRSIEVVRGFAGARLGPVYLGTRKGDITHAACPEDSVARAAEPARVRWVLFPRFEAGAEPRIEEIGRAEAFVLVSEQSFNNERMGEVGFEALCALLGGARCYELVYGSTEEALSLVKRATGDGAL
jgi:HprK-related kinase A